MKALYPRVSTREQAREGYSIDEQIERLKDYCKAMGWNEFKIYTDAGYSGGDTNRPALQEMIKDIEAGKIDKVVVYKLDRLSRSQKDTLMLIEDVFLANNCDFVSMCENFDTSTPFGRAMIGILAVFAQLEREQIKERMSMGREGRAKDGKWHGNIHSPVGYNYEDGRLIIDAFESMQIKELFDLFTDGKTIRSLEKLFTEKGYKHKYGKWTANRIRTVLKNDLYTGYVNFDGVHQKGLHDPIIDEETFQKAQKIFEARNLPVYSRSSTYLGGLIHCKRCTARYVKFNSRGYQYYGCHSRRKVNLSMVKDPNCKNQNYRMEVLDQAIFDEIRKLATDPDYIHEIKQENVSQDDIDKEKIIRKEIESIDTQRSRFLDLYGIGKYTIEELQAKTDPLDEQKRKLENQLKDLTAGQSEITVEEAVEIVSKFGDILDRGSYDEIRLTIESLIKKIVIDGDDITIYWKFA